TGSWRSRAMTGGMSLTRPRCWRWSGSPGKARAAAPTFDLVPDLAPAPHDLGCISDCGRSSVDAATSVPNLEYAQDRQAKHFGPFLASRAGVTQAPAVPPSGAAEDFGRRGCPIFRGAHSRAPVRCAVVNSSVPPDSVPAKMHDGEVGIDSALVRRLVAAQFPRFADRAVRAVDSSGTVNAIYRLGDDLYARLPRVSRWARDLEQELRWLPRLAACLSLQIPQPVAAGRPADGYPFCWAIYRWI